jgi:nucleotide-binding universal stress UspA family protein
MTLYEEKIMYTRMLIPLDGSKTAEKILPYARFLASRLKLPLELLAVIDIMEIAARMSPEKAQFFNTMAEKAVRSSEQYLRGVASTFAAANVKCTVEKGRPADVIIEKAAADKGTLISMATHGHSGINRWLLGSVAEKVLRGAINPLLLVRAAEEAKTEGEAIFRSVVVPLDGSELAETVLPTVAELAKRLNLEVVLFRAYTIPYSAYVPIEGYAPPLDDDLIKTFRDEVTAYLEKRTEAMRQMGVDKVSYAAKEGFAADEIIFLARKTPDNLIAMCSHGRSGVKRWVLGSVTETVVRHSGDPVLVIRAT